MKKIGLLMILGLSALTFTGCGDPSKSDVCGDCKDLAKDLCETGYDACDGDSDCISSVEDALSC